MSEANPGCGLVEDYQGAVRSILSRYTEPVLDTATRRRLETATQAQGLAVRDGAACGGLLLDRGLVAAAKEVFAALTRQFPTHPAGYVGLAQAAMREYAWSRALERWEEVADRFDIRANPFWQAARANVLAELNRLDEAETIFLGLTESFAEEPAGWVGLAQLAARRRLWTEALQRWDETIARFGGQVNPVWQAGRANVLLELQLLEEAEAIFQQLTVDCENQPQGFVGLAQIATRRRLWTEALARWDTVVERFTARVEPAWQAARAAALLELGRSEEAEATLRSLTKAYPELPSALLGLLRILVATGRLDEALRQLDSSQLAPAGLPALAARRFDILIRLHRLDAARAAFESILRDADDPGLLESLFDFTPHLYEGWRRTETWLALLRKVDSFVAQPDRGPGIYFAALRLRLFLALRDYEHFLAAMDRVADMRSLGRHAKSLLAVAAALRGKPFPDYGKPKIFGIGLSKTGTTTLAAALTALGFHTLDWANPLTRELMSESDLHLFDAFTDTPVCRMFEDMFYLFPNSKFLYTTRPIEDWLRSMDHHWRRNHGLAGFHAVQAAMGQSATFHHDTEFRNLHWSLYFNHGGYDEAYRSHDRRVRRFFRDKPSDRFLELDIFTGEGWQKLCPFLGVAVPNIPFPWENRKPAAQRNGAV